MPESMESSSNTLEFGHSHNQLVTKKSGSFKRIIVIFVIVVLLLLGCIIFVLMFQQGHSLPDALPQKVPSEVTLEKIMNGTFEAVRFNGTWVSDDEILMKNNEGYIVLFNVTSRSTKVLIEDKSVTDIAGELLLSADKKYLMVAYNMQRIYRHSSYSSYLVYDTINQKGIPITNSHNEVYVLNLVKWSTKGNGFVYVLFNNIFYRPNVTSMEDYQITFSGNASVYNGICDWVYEEEIFSDSNAMWFSPEGDKLAYATFNDHDVDVMSIPYYGNPANLDTQYPKIFNVRYPKPGRKNPSVTLSVVNLKGKKKVSKEITFSQIFSDYILTSVTWISNDEIGLIIMNRVQNQANILSCNLSNMPCKDIYALKSPQGWLNLFTPPLFSSDGQRMLFIHPWDQGGQLGAYRHLTMYDSSTKNISAITSGKFTVNDILSWDNEQNIVYYLATEEDNPRRRQLYRIKANTKPFLSECLSCAIEKNCTYIGAHFSLKRSYYVQTCIGKAIPTINIYDKNNNLVLKWEENVNLERLLKNLTLPKRQFLTYEVAPGMQAQVMLWLPPNIDKSGKKKYPLLVNVYGGPDSNQVYERYKVSWETYFCLNHEVVIAFIDGRGSGLKGDNMLFSNYRKLGTTEVEDQINVTRKLQLDFNFIDPQRTAIWGWSYGGYVTGMVLAMDSSNVFKCGVSVAPVTDWIYYDSIYTERYLGLPSAEDNKIGYERSSLIRNSDELRNKNYLLVHGTMDDNVHYQQSMMLARSMELKDILFRQQSYPDEAHSLGGVRHHFYRTLESFLEECFM